MIYGIGVDVLEPDRVARLLEKYGERFARRVLTDQEWPAYQRTRRPTLYVANRFAAKEAFSKALGTGIHAPANWHGVWVVNHRSGKPQLEFSDALAALLRSRSIHRSHLTLTDERGMAAATVILECDG